MELDRFLDELASEAPVPGGGSVAALAAASGAALVSMVAGLTVGRKRYAGVETEAAAIREAAHALLERSRRLIDEDAEAFRRVSQAMSLPRDTEAAKEERSARIQTALKGAVEPPLDTMRAALEVLALSGRIAAIGNKSAISDAASAALMAEAAFRVARLNVEINLAAIRDAGWVDDRRAELDRLGDVGSDTHAVVARAEAQIRGESE